MKLLGLALCLFLCIIYKSRNFMKLLGPDKPTRANYIYKSRNFMKLLGFINMPGWTEYLQE